MKFTKFIPLAKMEEQSDGTLSVFGIVTAEQPDLDREVCDYAGTKPYYKAKTAEMFKLTSAVDGMEPSLMPLREMHQLSAIGAGRSIEFDDAAKTIKMGFNVVDPTAVTKFKKGVLIGFSQGGDYVGDLIADPVFDGCKRYVADPAEVSAVDSPCLPVALVETMKGRTVPLTKVNGSCEVITLKTDVDRLAKIEQQLAELLKEKKTKRVDGADLTVDCFAHVGDPEKTDTWQLPIKFPGDEEKTKSHIRNALARFEQTEGMSADEKAKAKKKIIAAAKEHGIEVSETEKAAMLRAAAKAVEKRGIDLAKGLYEVGWLGDMLEQLHWLCLQTEFERDMEDDGSKVPENLREAWMLLLAEFKAMAVEEADELAAAGGEGANKAMKITTQEQLTKAAKTLVEHIGKLQEVHKAAGEHMKKAHEAVEAKHEAVGEHIEKCMKAAKDAAEGEEPEEAGKVAADPAVAKKLDDLTASVAELTKQLSKIPAPGAPHTGAGVDLNKAAIPAGLESVVNTAPVVTH